MNQYDSFAGTVVLYTSNKVPGERGIEIPGQQVLLLQIYIET
jgi:hypothetical protein